MMSRQDFVALAEAMLSVKKDVSSEQAEKLRAKTIAAIAAVCMAANRSFDVERFCAACNGAPYNPPRRRRRERPFTIQEMEALRASETARTR